MGFQFGAILAFALVAIGFAAGVLTAFRLIRPHFPEPDKAMIYECGEKPIGQAWFAFNPRFYLIALVFLIFEVEIALVELFLFTAILVVGLVWVWVHGDLEWIKKLDAVDSSTREGAKAGTPKSKAA